MHFFIGRLIPTLLLLTTLSAHAAELDATLQGGERLYTQQDVARLVGEALADKGNDQATAAIEFTPALPTFRLAAGAGPIVVEDVWTDPQGRRFAATLALPVGPGNVHRRPSLASSSG